jgi:predicted esterase
MYTVHAMPHFRFVRAALLGSILAGGLVLYAQDAGMVLRTSVTYRTQRNSLTLSDAQKQQADQLARDADQAGREGKFDEAIRSYYHGLAVMRGASWTPALEFASSLQGRLSHALAAAGDSVTVTLSPLYKEPDAAGIKMTAAVALVSPPKSGIPEKSLASNVTVDPAAIPFTTKVTIPADASGDYVLEVRLRADGETAPAEARGGLVKALPMHVEALAADAAKLRARLAKVSGNKNRALPSAAYVLDFYDRADRGDASPTAHHFREDFATANEILDAIEKGADPFAGKHGDFRKAYVSPVDHTLQPYRILVPEVYNGKPSALVVALHGMGGDENSIFDAYTGAFKPAAEKNGFIAVCPKGRDTASMYRGSAEQDVMDVLAEVQRDYKIDPRRIYLMGHSMGGYGTWSVAMAHPDVFAALGPISGGGNPAGMVKLARVPEYVVHGDADPTVPVTQSRTMVEAGKKAGAQIVYVEIPGGNHTNVVAPQFEPMLEFFAKQKKSASE